MYKLLIVDDEEIVCKGLTQFVNWSELGFEVVQTVHSVAQALVYLENNPVHAILTDIRMPIQTGLQLLEIVVDEYPDMKSVILSGYSDFEYARQALRLGAIDFITKPVNFEELKRIFRHVKYLLDEVKLLSQQKEEYLLLQKESYFRQLIHNTALPTAYSTQLGLMEQSDFFIIRFSLSLGLDDYSLLLEAKNNLMTLAENYFSLYGKCIFFHNTFQEICCILYPSNLISFSHLLEPFYDQLKQSINISTTLGISNTHSSLSSFSKAYKEAGKSLSYKVLKRKFYVLYQEVDTILCQNPGLTEDQCSTLLQMLNEGTYLDLIDYIHALFDTFILHPVSQNELYSFSIELLLYIYQCLSTLSPTLLSSHKIRLIIKEIVFINEVSHIQTYICDMLRETLKPLAQDVQCHNNLIQVALTYIQENYSEDITLHTLADILYLHPIYLSKLFKEKTGENFINYLTRVRIEKAKELLKDPSLKIYDISKLVGYESSKHFSKTFKGLLGITPREYRDSSNK